MILLPFLFLRPITFQLRMGVVRAAPGSRLRSVVPCIPECYVCGVVAPLIYVYDYAIYSFPRVTYVSRRLERWLTSNHFLLLKLLVCFKHAGVAGNHGN